MRDERPCAVGLFGPFRPPGLTATVPLAGPGELWRTTVARQAFARLVRMGEVHLFE